ncbi:MAG: hypothetical protein LBS33_06290 [Streptococcaceae bacterium]|jgi:hypothetical protein|nr:hypothetical protein [Streptococcaceae bacterium]
MENKTKQQIILAVLIVLSIVGGFLTFEILKDLISQFATVDPKNPVFKSSPFALISQIISWGSTLLFIVYIFVFKRKKQTYFGFYLVTLATLFFQSRDWLLFLKLSRLEDCCATFQTEEITHHYFKYYY